MSLLSCAVLLHGRWSLEAESPGVCSSGLSLALPPRSETKQWPSLACALMRLNPTTLAPLTTARTLRLERGRQPDAEFDTLSVRHQEEGADAGAAESSPSLTLILDGKPHTHPCPVPAGSSSAAAAAAGAPLTITASQLVGPASKGMGADLSVQIDLPAAQSKYRSFAEEQTALHRAGFLVERSHLPSRHRMVQVIEYRRAPATMKNEAAASIDTEQLPVVYAITRTYTRVEEPREPAPALGAAATSSAPSTPQSARNGLSRHASPRPGAPSPLPASASVAASASAAAAAAAPSALPPIPVCSLSGLWKVDRTRSDSLDPLMRELNVAWLARKVILSLEVLTQIQHDPARHHCVITDLSSAGEQATVHRTTGEVTTVQTKEGKSITMCAREGEELRVAGVWPDLPKEMLEAPLAFPPASSDAAFTFPAHLPRPIAPDLKLHPLPYGYLWIHSHLPDIPGGEMQDVRMLLDRDSMIQQTSVIKQKKLCLTTTRYFVRVETTDDKLRGEAAWEESIREWKRATAAHQAAASAAANGQGGGSHARGVSSSSAAGMDSDLDEFDERNGGYSSSGHSSRSLSRSSTGALTPMSPSMMMMRGAGALPLPGSALSNRLTPPNLSGVWLVWKERSNDLSVLLKRMGVPWIYRAFANTARIRTTITHTAQELTLKDTSALGSHSQSFQLDGAWHPVIQYGNQRHGQCLVTTDVASQSVTVETVWFASLTQEDRNRMAEAEAARTASAAAGAAHSHDEHHGDANVRHTPRNGTSFSEEPSFLTMESPLSPARPTSLALDEDEQRTDSPRGAAVEQLPRSQSAEHSPRASARAAAAEEAGGARRDARANSDPTARHMLLGDESLIASQEEEKYSSAAQSARAHSRGPSVGDAPSSSVLLSTAPTVSLPSTPTSRRGNGNSSSASSPAAYTPSSSVGLASPPLRPPSQGGSLIIASRLVDTRMLVTPELMRQVLTYSESDVVVCVCSRVYRRELSAEERKHAAEQEKNRRKEEEAKKKQDRQRKSDGGSGGASGAGAHGGSGSSGGGGVSGGPGASSHTLHKTVSAGASSSAPLSASHSSSSARPHTPVRVVVPPTALSSSVSLASAPVAVAPAPSAVSLASVTPARAALLFLLAAAVASGHRVLTCLLLAACVAYAAHQHHTHSASKAAEAQLARQAEARSAAASKAQRAQIPDIRAQPGLWARA